MLLSRAELEKKIADYREKADKAYMNYQTTGHARYDKTYNENTDMADTLNAYLNSEQTIRSSRTLLTQVDMWIETAEEINQCENEDIKNEKIEFLLKNILEIKGMMRFI